MEKKTSYIIYFTKPAETFDEGRKSLDFAIILLFEIIKRSQKVNLISSLLFGKREQKLDD